MNPLGPFLYSWVCGVSNCTGALLSDGSHTWFPVRLPLSWNAENWNFGLGFGSAIQREMKHLHAQRSCVAPAFLTVAGCFPRCPSHGALGARKTDGLTVTTNGHPVWPCFLLELLVASKKPRCHRTLSYLVSFSCYLRQDRSCCRKMTQK